MSDYRIKELSGNYIIQKKEEIENNYLTTDSVTWADTSAGPIVTTDSCYYSIPQTCTACKRTGELTGRNLCEECDAKIPEYIPTDQYNQYMKELWKKGV